MATINDINRVLIVMDLIKDGTVANAAPYASVDLFNGAKADGWVESFYTVYGPLYDNDGVAIPYASLTNDQKAAFYMDQQIEFHRQVRQSAEVKQAADAAATIARAAIETELTEDFGA